MTTYRTLFPRTSSAAVRIEVEFGTPQLPAVSDGIDWIIERFVGLANADGFSRPSAFGHCRVEARESDGLGYRVDLSVANLDPRCFVVIFFGVYSITLGHDCEPSRISLWAEGPTIEVDMAQFLEEEPAPYPGTSPEVERYVTRSVSQSKRRDVEFDLSGAPPPAILTIFEYWRDVARLSFPRDLPGFVAGRDFMINTSVETRDGTRIAVVVEDFQCHDSAIDPLIEALGRALLQAKTLRSIRVQ